MISGVPLCEICREASPRPFLDFGLQPNGNQFVNEPTTDVILRPLAFSLCLNCCTAIQLDTLAAKEMFFNHPYLTSKNLKYLTDLKTFANFILDNHTFAHGALALDVGCNDGSFLQILAEHGFDVVGIDPGEIPYRYSQEIGIFVIKDFFESGSKLKHFSSMPISVVTSTASFYHVPSPYEWLREARMVIEENGCIAIQFVDLSGVIEDLSLDQFYHEHTFLFSFTSVYWLAKRLELHVAAVEYVTSQGGSIRVILKKESNPDEETLVLPFLERDKRVVTESAIKNFHSGVETRRKTLTSVLEKVMRHNERIVGLGASLRGISLVNFLQLPRDAFLALAEVNREKIGLLTAQTLIPVVDEDHVPSSVRYYLVLARTEKKALIQKFQTQVKNGVSLIFPTQPPEIIGEDHLNLRALIVS